MKLLRLLLIFVLAGSLGSVASAAQKIQPTASPDAVVRELYRVHRNGYGHVFEKAGRKNQLKFFDRNLAALIWKDLTETPDGEVGNLDFDPLYSAQDMKITNFRVGAPNLEGSKASVPVSFNNYNQKTKIKFLLVNTDGVWKIENIIYDNGSDLVKILSATQ
jgi:hypothetical protein